MTDLHCIKVLNIHKSFVNHIFVWKNKKIISCSNDKTIKIFDFNNFQCECSITTDFKVYYVICLDNDRIVATFYNEFISIYSMENNIGCLEEMLTGHTDIVRKVIPLTKNFFASCSKDGTIKIWSSIFPYVFVRKLTGHKTPICSMIALREGGILVSCSEDKKMKFWDLLEYNCKNTVENIDCISVNSLSEEPEEHRIICAGEEDVTIVDSVTHEIMSIIKIPYLNSNSSFYSIAEFQSKIVFGKDNGNLYEMNKKTLEIKLLFPSAHMKYIVSLGVVSDEYLVTSSEDKTIKIWMKEKIRK